MNALSLVSIFSGRKKKKKTKKKNKKKIEIDINATFIPSELFIKSRDFLQNNKSYTFCLFKT